MYKIKPLTPLLLGANLCAYSVARAFHEYSGVKSYAFCRQRCALTQFSKIIKPYVYAGLDDFKVAGPAFFDFAKKHKRERLFIIPCSEEYTELAAYVAASFPDYYISYLPERDVRYVLRDKSLFYKMLKEEEILYPKTKVIGYGDEIAVKAADFSYPAVIKPSDSTHYLRYCPSKKMKKVYYPTSAEDAHNYCERLYGEGYRSGIILQEKIAGQGVKKTVLTVFFSNGVALRAVYGKVILFYTGATISADRAAIITEGLSPTSKKLIRLFERLGYSGFANFDMISLGDCEYVLDVSTGQGGCCDYMRAAGVNMAELLTNAVNCEAIEKELECAKVYWHYLSHYTVSALASYADRKEAEELLSVGLASSPLAYAPDIHKSRVRRAALSLYLRRLDRNAVKQKNAK